MFFMAVNRIQAVTFLPCSANKFQFVCPSINLRIIEYFKKVNSLKNGLKKDVIKHEFITVLD